MRNSNSDQPLDQNLIWEQAYNQLEQDFIAKENEVAMVAEIGKQLLEKNQEQQQLIEQLEEREAHNSSLIADLEQKLSQLSSESRGRSTSEGESTLPIHSGYIEQEYKRVQEKNEQISEAYESLQHQFDELSSQQKKKEKQSQSEIAELKKAVQGFEEQAQGYQSLFEQLNTRDSEYKKLVSQMELDREEKTNQQEELEKKYQTLNSSFLDIKKKLKEKEYEANNAKDQMELYMEEMKAYGDQMNHLQSTVATLVKHNSLLQQENKELSEQMAEERQQSSQFGVGHAHVQGIDSGSLFAELEKSMEGRSKTTDPLSASVPLQENSVTIIHSSTPSLVSPVKKEGNLRVIGEVKKNPLDGDSKVDNESGTMSDYFFTAAAAVKIGLFLKYPENAIQFQEIDLKKLYEQAQKEAIQFHEWHTWIGEQFNQRAIIGGPGTQNSFSSMSPQPAKPSQNTNVSKSDSPVPKENAQTPKRITTLPQAQERTNTNDPAFNELEKKTADYAFSPPSTSPIPMMGFLEEDETLDHKPYAPYVHKHQDQNTAMHKIFSFMKPSEFLIEFYNQCTMDTIRGNLYVTEHGIYFHSLRQQPTLRDLRVRLFYKDLKNILRPFGFFQRTKDVFHVETKTGIKFVFGNFLSIDSTFEIVKKLFQTHSTELGND